MYFNIFKTLNGYSCFLRSDSDNASFTFTSLIIWFLQCLIHWHCIWCSSWLLAAKISNDQNTMASSLNNLYDQNKKTKLLPFLLQINEDISLFPSKQEQQYLEKYSSIWTRQISGIVAL